MLKYLLIFIPLFSQAQITFFGEIKNSNLSNLNITVIKSSGSIENISKFDKQYKIELDWGFIYDIQFKKSGYLTKTVRIDTRNVPFEDRRGRFEIELDGRLIKLKEGMDESIGLVPSTFSSYNHKKKNFEFDSKVSIHYNNLIKREGGKEKSTTTSEIKKEVTELVYYEDNRKITEREVSNGKWVDVYTKIESEHFTFYFKNDFSITETIWKIYTE